MADTNQESILGSNLSGSSGDVNRTYTLANTGSLSAHMKLYLDGSLLQLNKQYTKSGDIITFLNNIWDDQALVLDYYTISTASSTDIYSQLQADAIKTINSYGTTTRIKYYTGSVSNADFDDAQVLSQSGSSVWTSGLMFPVKSVQGSFDAVLLEQGKIKTSDKKLFIAGNVATSETMKIGVGSPVSKEHSIIPDGIISYPPVGNVVYKKIYMRELKTGSLAGE